MKPAGSRVAAVIDAFKPRLPLMRIVEMNLGFLGLQFSFGLQQSNMATDLLVPRRERSQHPVAATRGGR